MVPATKPVGSVDATPRYGSGSVNINTEIGTVQQNNNIVSITTVRSIHLYHPYDCLLAQVQINLSIAEQKSLE